jgi:hypothetical protein
VTHSEMLTPPASTGGLFENLIEVLFAPSKVFDRTRAAKALKYAFVTAVVVGVIMFATKNLLQPWFDAQGDLALAQLAAKGKPVPEAAASAMRSSTSWGLVAGLPLVMLFGPFLNAVLLFFGAMLMKVKVSYSQLAVIATLGGVPRMLGVILMPVQALLLDGANAKSLADLSLGPARFLDASKISPALVSLASQFDVFRVWQLALIAIGVAVVGRVSLSTAAVVTIVMAAVAAMLQLLPAAVM